MKRSTSFVLVVMLSIGCLSFRPAPPDLSSPKSAVKSFIAAAEAGDVAALVACIKNGVESPELKQMFTRPNHLEFEVTEILAEIEGKSARVAIEYTFKNAPIFASYTDILALEQRGKVWQIVVAPDALSKYLTSPQVQMSRLLEVLMQKSVIKTMTILIGDPKGMEFVKQAKAQAKIVSSLSNVKQIGTAAMMYMQDYDEILPTPAANYKDLLSPYIKSEQVFRAPSAPESEKVSYSFNKNLEGVSIAALSSPSQTVMIYEGKDMKPEYRYEGKTVIGFADGHAKLHTPEEFARFIWSEKEWKPRAKSAAPKPAPKKKSGKKR